MSRRDPARRASFASIRRAGTFTRPKRTGGLRTRTITNVLGQTRKASLYADGSYTCPFCGYGVRGTERHCPNPACSAAKYRASGGTWRFMQTAASIQKSQADARAYRQAEERRKRDHEHAMQRAREATQERAAAMQNTLAEARKRGACTERSCLNLSGYGTVKFVKHRGGVCPKRRR